MRKKKRFIIQGEALNLAFFHVGLPVVDGEKYAITDKDILTFTIGRKNRKPVLTKTYPGEIVNEGDDNFFVYLTAEDTRKLPCLRYQMQLTVDVEGIGEEIYTLVKYELEVVAK